jgi:hypothetical protein
MTSTMGGQSQRKTKEGVADFPYHTTGHVIGTLLPSRALPCVVNELLPVIARIQWRLFYYASHGRDWVRLITLLLHNYMAHAVTMIVSSSLVFSFPPLDEE